MAKSPGINRQDATRIVNAVKRTEASAAGSSANSRFENTPPILLVKITGSTGAGTSLKLAWQQVRAAEGGGPEDGPLKGTTAKNYAISLVDPPPVTNDVVTIVRVAQNKGGGTFAAVWAVAAAPGFFPVLLSAPASDGGADGSRTTTASWKYVVKDRAGNVLKNSDTTPIGLTTARRKGTMVRAAHGMACYGADGSLQIWWCDEVPGTTGSCS